MSYVFAPFRMDKCALTQNSWICHIISYLWMVGLVMRLFFPVGPTFGDHPHVFSQKRSSPLEFIFDTCASASSSHLFWLVKLNICGCSTFARINLFSAKKHVFCILSAHWHKILEFVTSFPIYGWLAWWCDFFPVGPTFEDHPHVFSQKRSSPLEFIFDTCASASSSHLFGWWSWTYVVVAFC